MTRRRRIAEIGDILHVMTRGFDGQPIFLDDHDRDVFLSLLCVNLTRAGCQCYAWALMPNHYHLVLRPLDQAPGMFMRRLNGAYARYFNRVHQRRGYLFQDRYKSLATRDFSYFRELIRYVHLNPVRAALVSGLNELADYHWTGHTAVIGKTELSWQSVTDLLARFGRTATHARKAYLQFLTEGMGAEQGLGPLAALQLSPGDLDEDGTGIDDRVVGDAARVRESIGRVEREEAAHRKRLGDRPSLSEISASLAGARGMDPALLQCRGRRNASSALRVAFCRNARVNYGYTYRDIGAYLGITSGAVIKAIMRQEDDN